MENGLVLTYHSCGEARFPILEDASLMSGFQALSQMKFLTSQESLINKSKNLWLPLIYVKVNWWK